MRLKQQLTNDLVAKIVLTCNIQKKLELSHDAR